jgi:hypothetical protein
MAIWARLFSENAFLKVCSYLLLLVGGAFLLSWFNDLFGIQMFGHRVEALIFGGVLWLCAFLIEAHRYSRLPKEEQDKLNSRKACLPIDDYWW